MRKTEVVESNRVIERHREKLYEIRTTKNVEAKEDKRLRDAEIELKEDCEIFFNK